MGVRKGVLLGKKEFTLDLQSQIEQEFLRAFYSTNKIPREILVNKICWEGNSEKSALESYLTANRGAQVSVIVPNRGNKLALVKLAEKNLESALDEDSALVDLQVALNLPCLPRVVDSFDISNLGQEHIVSGMVRFKDMKPDKSNYRKFKIKTVVGQDDFASVHEVVNRRYKRLMEEEAPMPDLVIIDGGPGQIGAARKALESLGIQIPLIGLAKEREEIYLPDEQKPKNFDKDSRMMLFLRKVRDETHRFALGYNLKRREMKMREEFKQK
jgi:excinuclease ABC subunit C